MVQGEIYGLVLAIGGVSVCMYICTHLSSEPTEESKEELREGEDKVLVEEIAQKRCHPVIRPATMYK